MARYRLNFTFYLSHAYVLAASSYNLSLSQIVSAQILGRNEQEEENNRM
jgi:hypothetical protein